MLIEIALIVFALLLLVGGGEFLVKGGVGLARRFGVSPMMIGVTIIAYGTSMPELVVSVDAALVGSPGIAVGNVIGSNIFNILMILGITALVMPLAVNLKAIKRDGSFAVFAALLFVLIAIASGVVTFAIGLGMLLLLAGMSYITYRQEKTQPHQQEADEEAAIQPSTALLPNIGWVALGLGLLIAGADLLVDNAVTLARGFGISETVIGLTLVAIGTSLPELFTSVMAAIRKHPDVALGNVIGSNIYNIMAILGAAALIKPTPIPQQIINSDMWVMLAATLLLVAVCLGLKRISRLTGAVFVALAVGYTYWLFLHAPVA